MAESGTSKSGMFAKVIQKRVVRTKEKLLENLGKADRTTDDVFTENVSNFHKQQTATTRLQKDLKSYLTCVKAMSVASANFYSAIRETYEPDWVGYEEVSKAVESLSMLWEDYLRNLAEQVQNPLAAYINRFPEVKVKMNKRGRKLTDFDSSRHNLAAQQSSKKPDTAKIGKAQEELSDAKKIYEELNNELHEELPNLYENRINFLASNFLTFFSAEAKFQEESAKCKTEMAAMAERLSNETSKAIFGGLKGDSLRGGASQASEESSENNLATHYPVGIPNDLNDDLSSEMEIKANLRESGESDDAQPSPRVVHKPNGSLHDEFDEDVTTAAEVEQPYEPITVGAQLIGGEYSVPDIEVDDIYKVPSSNEPVDNKLPKGVIYQVQATHPYTGEDTDELTFDAGDVINVVPFDDPEDQDEGWLMGLKPDGDRGMFPANFTKRI